MAVKKIEKDLMHAYDPSALYLEIMLSQHPVLVAQEHVFSSIIVYETKKFAYVTMEHLSGGEISVLRGLVGYCMLILDNSTPREVGRVIAQCLNGLVYLHELGIIHRDIKPENILFTDSERAHVRIIDYGLACYVNVPPLRKYVGTKEYQVCIVCLCNSIGT